MGSYKNNSPITEPIKTPSLSWGLSWKETFIFIPKSSIAFPLEKRFFSTIEIKEKKSYFHYIIFILYVYNYHCIYYYKCYYVLLLYSYILLYIIIS